MRAEVPVAAIVQARMTSSRLPGKVLEQMGPCSTLELLCRRLEHLTEASEVVVATSDDTSDDPVAELVDRLGLRVVRGPLEDVLDRYRLAAAHVGCDAVVRLTADCPLTAPEVVDRLIRIWRADERLDYVWNTREPRTFPDGLDVEVVSRSALEQAAEETREPYDREHVTPFIRERPDRFPQQALRLEPPVRTIKLSLDTPQDLAAIRAFVEQVGPEANLDQILAAAGGGPARMVVD